MNTLKRYLGIVTILTILALLIGTASAADTTGTSVRGNGTFTMGTGHQGHAGNTTQQHQMLQSFITKLGQRGVSVIEIQADIASGNIPAAIQWLKSYYLAHPDQMMKGPRQQMGNTTQQHQMFQSAITKLGQQGVDISQPQSEITSGNISSAMQWLKSYYQAHPEKMTKGIRQQTTGNITQQQRNAGFTSHNQTLQERGPVGHSWAQNRTQNTRSPQ
jgi:hypothetical protein